MTVILLAGHHATGKTEAGKVFAKAGYAMVDTGPLIREVHRLSSPEKPFRTWVSQGEYEHGPDFTNHVLVGSMGQRLEEAALRGLEVVVVGFRSLSGILYLQENVRDPLARAIIVYLEMPSELVLRGRWMAREGRFISPAAFRELLISERDAGIEEIWTEADHRITNTGCLETFRSEVLKLRDSLTACRNVDFTCVHPFAPSLQEEETA